MKRIKALNRYQKGILLLLIAMIVVFGVIYSAVSSRVGYLYNDVILLPSKENGNTVYSGTIQGQDCAFTVAADKTVTFRCGEKIYGPYTVKEYPSAIPKGDDFAHLMTGVEVREGNTVIFRGGIFEKGWIAVNEDGTGANFAITSIDSYGNEIDLSGNRIDPIKPTILEILQLTDGPELTKKGEWQAWFMGIFLSVITGVSILFADEFFRWNLAFQISNAESAEPSDWEIASRHIGWTLMTLITLVIYITGLQ